jgi:hypothetical protein
VAFALVQPAVIKKNSDLKKKKLTWKYLTYTGVAFALVEPAAIAAASLAAAGQEAPPEPQWYELEALKEGWEGARLLAVIAGV